MKAGLRSCHQAGLDTEVVVGKALAGVDKPLVWAGLESVLVPKLVASHMSMILLVGVDQPCSSFVLAVPVCASGSGG